MLFRRVLSPSYTLTHAKRALSTTSSAAANAKAIAEKGKQHGLKFYQFSFSDLYGVQRGKLVPASRVEEIAEGGAGFAGFAAWLDMDPTMGDLLAVPDQPRSRTAVAAEVGWLSCNLVHEDTNSRTAHATCCAPCRQSARPRASRSRAASSASSSYSTAARCQAAPPPLLSPTLSTHRASRATTRTRLCAVTTSSQSSSRIWRRSAGAHTRPITRMQTANLRSTGILTTALLPRTV